MTEGKKLKDLEPGAWFTKKILLDPKGSQVWIKGEYDRSEKKYLITRWSDISDSQMMKGDTIVYTDGTF